MKATMSAACTVLRGGFHFVGDHEGVPLVPCSAGVYSFEDVAQHYPVWIKRVKVAGPELISTNPPEDDTHAVAGDGVESFVIDTNASSDQPGWDKAPVLQGMEQFVAVKLRLDRDAVAGSGFRHNGIQSSGE